MFVHLASARYVILRSHVETQVRMSGHEMHIPHERKTPLRKLYADLMRPPRVQADKDKAPAFAHGQAADRQARGLLVGLTRAGFPGNDLFAALCADCTFCQMILKAFRASIGRKAQLIYAVSNCPR